MQSKPIEHYHNVTLESYSVDLSAPLQHGLPHEHAEAFDQSRTPGAGRELSPSPFHAEAELESVSSETSRRSRGSDSGRLSCRDDSSQTASTVNRVARYENQHIREPRMSAGITFQVVPSAEHGATRASVEDFPNGRLLSFYCCSMVH